ncbi:Tetratricopeptide repeat-containing protein [Actinacidiphila yanglinensis]|uniref:Tetratricopeptide repeat-containing protein n=1 Tax=Actinacidiphila yanglinensis TaxID=310779 RepID=A0A1H5VPM3_9ACTN|nr:FxSxx-COOH system tetratricopeptide repeat protein [Actinacidiphila yanglinensis]SEF89170.1 Tetratricopeptide repeat-containing protein [Actinacidiphila yanglinensis]
MRPGSDAGPPFHEPPGAEWFEIADALYLAAHGAGASPQRHPAPGPGRTPSSPEVPQPAGGRTADPGAPEPREPDPSQDAPEPGAPAAGDPPGGAEGRGPAGAAPRPAGDPARAPEREGGAGPPHRPGEPPGHGGARPRAADGTGGAAAAAGAGAAARAGSVAPEEMSGAAALPGTTLLRDPRALARALRPFKRRYPSGTTWELDEDATADAAAQGGRWLPLLRPARERWMDAVLVVDTSASMTIWRRPAAEFAALLRRTGAFRDVRVRRVDGDRFTDADVRADRGWPGAAARHAAERRRVVMVLTDAVGAAWQDGTAQRALLRWSASSSVVVVQVLAQAMWYRTGLPAHRAEIRVPAPGAPTAAWRVAGRSGPAVPVVALDADWLARWSRLAAGLEPVAPGVWSAFPGDPAAAPPEPGPEPTPRERVMRFRAEATPAAWNLAARLAAVPLNIPTMEYVLRAGATSAGPAELSEVLLGGLLRRIGDDPLDASEISHDFHDGVRELLLAAGRRDESRYLLMGALERQSRRLAPLRELRSVVAAGTVGGLRLTPRVLPYAQVQVKVMNAISGPYLAPARALGARLDQARAADTPRTPAPIGRTDPQKTAISGHGRPAVEVSDMADPHPTRSAEPLTADAAPGAGSPDAAAEHVRGPSVPSTPVRAGSSPDATERRVRNRPKVWSVPTRNANFTGRGVELADLHDSLSAGGSAAVLPEALHGLGGVGKSQIAIEYIYRHASEYDVVWWIPAERPEQIKQSLSQLGPLIGMDSASKSSELVANTLEALSSGTPYHRWLLVFDNAEDPEVVREFFPTGDTGRIMITSRNAHWSRLARTVDVDVFTVEESVELLRRRGPELDTAQAARIAEALGNLPLAIEQAAAWLSETGMPVDEYLQVFEEERADLIQRRSELLRAGVPVDYPEPVAAAWNMSLRRLGETNPGAFQLLQICSFFAPEPIPRRYFSGVRGVQLPRELTEVLRDPIKLGHAIRAISRYALIRVNYRDSTIQMHRLVRAVLVGQMSATERYDMRHGAHVLLANSDPGGSGAAGDWAAYAELLVHARFSRAVECDDHWVRQLVSNLVIYLGGRGDYATCLDYGREVLEWWNEHLGASDLQTLTVARTVARVMRLVGEHEEAAAMNLRSLELVREHHGPDHPATLFTMSAVAQDARIKGDFAAMLELERDRWQRAVREFDEGGPDTLASANDYALALRRTGDFAAALAIDSEAKEQADLTLGQDSMLTLLLTSNLSIDIRETGEYLRARDMQEQTMQRVLQVVGDAEAPLSLVAARNLATARRKAGDHQGSVEALESTVHAYRQRLNRHNTNLSSAVLAMSMALRQNADLMEARKVGEEAHTTLRDLLGAGHPYTLAASTDLAVTLRLLGDVETARRMNEEAATRLTERLGAGHPTAMAAAANLASDRYTLADYAEAEELDSQVVELCRGRLGPDHPTTLALSLNLSLDLRALGRAQEAADLHTATVERFRATLGAAHPATVGAARGMRADCDADIE